MDQSSLKSSQPIQSTSVGLRTQTLQTSNAGDTASVTASLSILDDVSKSTSSKMGFIRLAPSPSRSEVESSEEPVSEATADSLHGNPSPYGEGEATVSVPSLLSQGTGCVPSHWWQAVIGKLPVKDQWEIKAD